MAESNILVLETREVLGRDFILEAVFGAFWVFAVNCKKERQILPAVILLDEELTTSELDFGWNLNFKTSNTDDFGFRERSREIP